MVRALHAAGIEVILDVVYNHTAEGNHLGPTLSFKGIDNAAYYRLVEDDQRYYMDYTGTGNSLNVRHPHSLQLIMDSLRYWVTEMHVDGFRFDLAADAGPRVLRRRPAVDVLRARAAGPGRQPGEADRRAVGRRPRRLPGRRLPAAVDRVERQVPRHRPRLLARRAVAGRVRQPARRAPPTSTSTPGAGPVASINFVTAHDGFTLRDLVSYNEKHNEANGEDNNDGESHNRSWNHGVEGPTDDPEILGLRARAAAQLPRHAAAQPGRADAAARRRARPHPGRQQQHLRPGLRDLLDALGRRRPAAGRVHRGGRAAAHATTRRSAASASSPARRCAPATASASTTSSGCTPTAARWRTATGPSGDARSIGMYLNGDGIAGLDARGQHDRRRPLPALLQRRRPTTYGDPAARGVRRGLGRRDRHRRRREPDDAADGRVRRRRSRAAACSCCASTRRPEDEPDSLGRRVASPRRRPREPTRPDEPGAAGYDDAMRTPVSTYRLQITARLRPARGRRARCPTCTTSASTGSTSRRCSRPSPAATTATTSSPTTASTPPRGGAEGLAALSAEARRLGHGRARRHRAQPRRRRHPARERVVVGPADARPRRRAYADAFDVDWDAGGGRVRIPVVGDDDVRDDGRIEHLRSTATSCGTTTTASRSRPARGDGDDPTRCTPAALRAGRLAAWPTTS